MLYCGWGTETTRRRVGEERGDLSRRSANEEAGQEHGLRAARVGTAPRNHPTQALRGSGGVTHPARPRLAPPALNDGQVLLRRPQRPSLAAIARVAEELPVPRRVAAVRPLFEAGPHEPAVRPGGWLVDATDTPPANEPGATSAHGSSAREVVVVDLTPL